MLYTHKDLQKYCGQLILCGFEGTTLTAELKEIIKKIKPLGLIFFKRNIVDVYQLRELICELKSFVYPQPLLICVDQEGGRVARLDKPCTLWPPMASLGLLQDNDLAYKVGQSIALELQALGFDMDFAPVLDVHTNAQNPIIGNRSFSENPQVVAQLASSFIQGMQDTGIAACGKHFPGHGDTDSDSHLTLPYVQSDLQRLQKIEWPPFEAAAEHNVAAIMTAHIMVPKIDSKNVATLSKTILNHLREDFQFQGAILSDDIEMQGLSEYYAYRDIGPLGLQAGIDIFLACRSAEVIFELYEGMILAAEKEHNFYLPMRQSLLQAQKLYTYYAPPLTTSKNWQASIGSPQHQALAKRLQQAWSASKHNQRS